MTNTQSPEEDPVTSLSGGAIEGEGEAPVEPESKRSKTTDSSSSTDIGHTPLTSRSIFDYEYDPDPHRSSLSRTSSNVKILSSDIIDRTPAIQTSYRQAKPFPYGHIHNLFHKEFLERVRTEIKSHSKVNFKESDLFRVYQSIDLANLKQEESTTKSFPHLMMLREVLYSQQWRSLVEEWTDIPSGTLTSQIDCACNCHAPGCHLLCHDDVIGTRKISYIIYLTEDPWDILTDGGALELYGPQLDDPHCRNNNEMSTLTPKPTLPIPTARAAPTFNSMAFFVVQAGTSFHAVQEVIGSKPRLSLQGWYHTTDQPTNINMATLQQLKQKQHSENHIESGTANADTTAAAAALSPSIPLSKEEGMTSQEEETLTPADVEYLSKYVKSEYLTKESLDNIQTKFEIDSSVQLRGFLQPQWIPTSEMITKADEFAPTSGSLSLSPSSKSSPCLVYDDDYYTMGMTEQWNLVGPAHKQRYLRYNNNNNPNTQSKEPSTMTATAAAERIGELLHHVQQHVFESAQFKRFLHRITSLGQPMTVRHQTSSSDSCREIRRFRPGLDYTVAHYGQLLRPDEAVLDATMCFVVAAHDGGGESSRSEDPKTQTAGDDDDDDDVVNNAGQLWESGDVGGFECYIEADDDDEDDDEEDEEVVDGLLEDDVDNDVVEKGVPGETAVKTEQSSKSKKSKKKRDKVGPADEYNEDDDTELLSVSASNNTLSLVYRDPGIMRFVKYVSSSAPSSRYDICMEYDVPPPDSQLECDDDDDDDKDDEAEKGFMVT